MCHALLSLSLSFAGLAPQQPPAVLDVLPLQHVCGQRPSVAPPPWATLLRWTDPDSRPDLLHAREPATPIDADMAVGLLRALHAEASESGKLSIEADATNLILAGDSATVGQIRDEVQQLSAVLTRPIEVQVTLWAAGRSDTVPAVLAPGDWKANFRDRQVIWRSTAMTRSAQPAALDGQRWTTYVRDIDVEVAQKQSTSQPVSDAFCDGGRVVVVPHTLLGGDELALHVQFGFGRKRGPVRTVPTGIAGQSDLDVPTIESTYGVSSARIGNGGGIAITLTGDAAGGGNYILTIRAGSPTPPPTTSLAGISALPCSALTSRAMLQRMAPPNPYPSEGDEIGFDGNEADGSAGHLGDDRLIDLLHAAIGDDGENELQTAGGFLFVRGPEAVRTKVEAVLRALQDRLVRTVVVRHNVALPGGLEPQTYHHISAPSLVGREALVARLIETRAIDRLWVEIAQEAAIHNPDVHTLQIGSWLRFCAAPQGEQMNLQMLAQCTHAPMPQLRAVVPSGGNLLPSDVSSTRVVHDGAVANGQILDQGQGPIVAIDGQPTPTDLTTRVTW